MTCLPRSPADRLSGARVLRKFMGSSAAARRLADAGCRVSGCSLCRGCRATIGRELLIREVFDPKGLKGRQPGIP